MANDLHRKYCCSSLYFTFFSMIIILNIFLKQILFYWIKNWSKVRWLGFHCTTAITIQMRTIFYSLVIYIFCFISLKYFTYCCWWSIESSFPDLTTIIYYTLQVYTKKNYYFMYKVQELKTYPWHNVIDIWIIIWFCILLCFIHT